MSYEASFSANTYYFYLLDFGNDLYVFQFGGQFPYFEKLRPVLVSKRIMLNQFAVCEDVQFLVDQRSTLWANAFEKLDLGVKDA
jgi:hypothetical protein